MIQRRIRYTDVAHRDPSRRLVLATEHVIDDEMDTFLQIRSIRQVAATVTTEFFDEAGPAMVAKLMGP